MTRSDTLFLKPGVQVQDFTITLHLLSVYCLTLSPKWMIASASFLRQRKKWARNKLGIWIALQQISFPILWNYITKRNDTLCFKVVIESKCRIL